MSQLEGRSVAGKIEIVAGEAGHIVYLAQNMRQADKREVWASCRATPLEALEDSFTKSDETWVGLIDGKPFAMFGVGEVNLLAGIGAPWLLGTDEIEHHPMTVLRTSRRAMAYWQTRYRLLTNYVDGRNVVSQRWLQWAGFQLREQVMMGDVGFWRFEWRARTD